MGVTEVNESVSYSDAEGNVLKFPSPTLEVDCGLPVVEPCPEPADFVAYGCSDTIEFDAGDVLLQSMGRIALITFTVKRVCPNRRVAVAVILDELDEEGDEHRRGMKTFTIPAHTNSSCRDVLVRCVKFVLPEDVDETGSASTCNVRNLRVRVVAHYIDSDFECCE